MQANCERSGAEVGEFMGFASRLHGSNHVDHPGSTISGRRKVFQERGIVIGRRAIQPANSARATPVGDVEVFGPGSGGDRPHQTSAWRSTIAGVLLVHVLAPEASRTVVAEGSARRVDLGGAHLADERQVAGSESTRLRGLEPVRPVGLLPRRPLSFFPYFFPAGDFLGSDFRFSLRTRASSSVFFARRPRSSHTSFCCSAPRSFSHFFIFVRRV